MGLLQAVEHVNLTIEIGPEAFEQARQFYCEVLELTQLPRPENTDSGRPGLWLAIGESGQQIHISSEPNATTINSTSRRHCAFKVSDLAGLRAKLTAVGAKLAEGEEQVGRARFFAYDPFGNRLEFFQLSD